MPAVPELIDDLDAEYLDLRHLLEALPPDAPEWDLATPSEGWAVRDQISHLAFFDETGKLAMTAPEQFAAQAAVALDRDGDPMEEHLTRGRVMDGDQLLAWWGDAHRGLVGAAVNVDPDGRIPWYGPPMSARSFVSARLMEAWAHGQDVVDALGYTRDPTDRLRHVAHLGVRARPFSYRVRGRDVPPGRIGVELNAPTGGLWSWETDGSGDDRTVGSVTGPALDFCLVVTQRRNVADTSLQLSGVAAVEWISIAQAFAGPPSLGRPPIGSPPSPG